MFKFNFPEILDVLRRGTNVFRADVPVALYDEIERLARDAEGTKYISIKGMGDADGMTLKDLRGREPNPVLPD